MEKTDIFGKRYEVLEQIGKGGMGKVYKVRDRVSGEELALKVLSRNYEDSPSAGLKFKDEYRIMSEFRHPNTVRVYEMGITHEKRPFITMEYIKGVNLSEFKKISVGQWVDLMCQICEALSYIHSRLYVHRDLKPDNIKVLEDGSIKLLDYGLMCQLGVPASGKISGTYYYLAPEVITGGIIDESTDLYSLGIIGYEMLTGERPFTGGRREILRGHLKTLPTEPINMRPDIPSSVNRIVLKLLEKGKDNRYRNASEVLEDLHLLTGRKVPAETEQQKEGYLYSSKMVGRDKEIEEFKKILDRLSDGIPSSLMVGAPAGIGKTRLLREMKTLAELEGMNSLWVDSQEAGNRVYGFVEEILKKLPPLSTEEEINKYGKVLRRSVPEGEVISCFVDWFISVCGRTPLILFLDDLHWMDLKSISCLNHLIRQGDRQEGQRFVIIGSFRSNEVDKSSPLWHTVEEGLSKYREILPLSEKETRILLDNLLYPTRVSEDFIYYCFRNSGGNIFDLMEFLRYLITGGLLVRRGNQWLEPVNPDAVELPESVEDRLLFRIGKLEDTPLRLAYAASILHDMLNLENWQAISEYESFIFLKSIYELMKNQIIVKADEGYSFAHNKIRTALYKSIPKEEKSRYHKKSAEYFLSKVEKDGRDLIPIIARHFVSAEDIPHAIEFSLKAGKLAEENNAEWLAFDHYRDAERFLEKDPLYPQREDLLLEIYHKSAKFSSAAWTDAVTCLRWLEKGINHWKEQGDMKKVFDLSLSYIVSACVSSNYLLARKKVPEIIETCHVQEGSLEWAILFGAGVCLIDWYQGFQEDLYAHAVASREIFEKNMDNLPAEMFPAYSWSIFWREKALAYMGKPLDMNNVEKNRILMTEGKSDSTIYWHTLTAVGARAAYSGRYEDLLEWKDLVGRLSREMGKIHWFECWISHSYLYGSLNHGEFSHIENHLERVQASPDPYQVRLAYLFRGIYRLIQKDYRESEENLLRFLGMEEKNRDNSYLEGFIYLAKLYMEKGETEKAKKYIDEGYSMSTEGELRNPLYKMQFLRLRAELNTLINRWEEVEENLLESLEIARTSDNPIQQGFIYKSLGEFYHKKGDSQKAYHAWESSRDLFLSVNNKYQAGQVLILLENQKDTHSHVNIISEAMAEDYPKEEKDILLKTLVEEEKSQTDVREESEYKESKKEETVSVSDSKTAEESVELEKTEAED